MTLPAPRVAQIIYCADDAEDDDEEREIYHDYSVSFVFRGNIAYITVCSILNTNISVRSFNANVIYYYAAMRNRKNAFQVAREARIEVYMHIQWESSFQEFFRTRLAYKITSKCCA